MESKMTPMNQTNQPTQINRSKPMFWLSLALLSLTTCFTLHAAPASTGLEDENLLQNLPDGFKIVTQERKGNFSLMEMVPKAESVDDWTQMVTTQIFYGAGDLSFDNYKADMEQRWKAACDTSDSTPVTDGHENGYAFRIWLETCHFNDTKRKPEITWFKIIQGNDSAYVVQVAFHFEPSKEQVVQWMRYLKKAVVCDSRLKDRACPAVK